jgi:N-acyl-phosphatidylethanolamine-hydrolysing phospholipase D
MIPPLQRMVYKNEFPHPHHGLLDVLRWKLGCGPRETPPPAGVFTANQWSPLTPDFKKLQAPDPSKIQLTWIGHSTFLIQHRHRNILTDPIFGDCLTPLPGLRLRRRTPPGLSLDQLPTIHDTLISHCHYEHLDAPTVKRLGHATHFWLPSGLGQWFQRKHITRFRELAWWESARLNDDIEIHSVPAQHFSARGPFDRDRTHWCGWVLRSASRTIYFAGDTGYCPGFQEIGRRFGGVNLALIPIGAYRPRWLMQPVHVDPFEAVKIHQDVRSRFSVGGHWGTFRLTDEPLGEPPALLNVALAAQNLSSKNFGVLRPGETMVI